MVRRVVAGHDGQGRWHNRGRTTATLVSVVIGAEHEAFPDSTAEPFDNPIGRSKWTFSGVCPLQRTGRRTDNSPMAIDGSGRSRSAARRRTTRLATAALAAAALALSSAPLLPASPAGATPRAGRTVAEHPRLEAVQ